MNAATPTPLAVELENETPSEAPVERDCPEPLTCADPLDAPTVM